MLENCVVFTSLIHRVKNSRKNAHRKLEVPMPAAMLCKTRREDTHSFLHPFFYHIGHNLSGHFLPQARGLFAFLSQASIENETALHVFKHGCAFGPQQFTQEGCYQPSVCIVAVIICSTCFGFASSNALDVPACQIHGCFYGTAEFQRGLLFLLPLPVFLVVNLSSSLAGAGSFSLQLFLCANTSNSQVLLFQKKNNTGRVPRRHHRCKRNSLVASDPFLWFSIRFSQEGQFHNLSRTWRFHLTKRCRSFPRATA